MKRQCKRSEEKNYSCHSPAQFYGRAGHFSHGRQQQPWYHGFSPDSELTARFCWSYWLQSPFQEPQFHSGKICSEDAFETYWTTPINRYTVSCPCTLAFIFKETIYEPKTNSWGIFQTYLKTSCGHHADTVNIPDTSETTLMGVASSYSSPKCWDTLSPFLYL